MARWSGDLGEAIYRSIVGTRMPKSMATEPDTFGAAVGYWLAKAGSVSGAARALDVPRRTFRDWVAGSRPRDPQRARTVVRLAVQSDRRDRLPRGRERALRAGDASAVQIVGTYNYDGGPRRVDIGPYLDPDALGELVDAYLAGADATDLRETFADLITDDGSGFYARTLRRPATDSHGWTVTSVHPFGGAAQP